MAYQRLEIKREIENAAPKAGFELSEQQIQNLKTVGQVALATTIVGGVVALSAVAPNIFVALDKVFGKKQYGSRKKTLEERQSQLAKSFYYLRRQGFIEMKKSGDLLYVTPTKKGRKRIEKLGFANLQIPAPRKWWNTWWLVLADVPSKQFRSQAYLFQKKLKKMGFYSLQRTVWVYPFDPREEVEVVAAHYRISSFVTCLEAKRLDPSDEKLLREYFREIKVI